MNDYRIVVLGKECQWLDYSIKDLKKIPNTDYFGNPLPTKNDMLNILSRIHFSEKVNSIIKLPFKSIWYCYFANNICRNSNDNLILVIYDRNRLGNRRDFLDYLKKHFSNIKLVYVFTDLVSVSGANKNNFVDDLSEYYDVVYAFEEDEAKKYGFRVSQLLYSKCDFYNELPSTTNIKLLMVGSVNKFVFLEINGSFLVRIRICKFLSKRSVFMPVAKEQIRQIISENNLNSVTDVYALLRDSFKDILQELMEAELDAALGYEKNRKGDLQTDNKRNGHSPKNLKSQYGEFQIDVPRDRNGEFEPKLIPKYQRDISGIEEKVISLYARGMSTRDIHDQLNDLYGIELSAEMVSKITDKILPQVKEWQSRPLNPVYPFVFMDCIHYKVREDGRILSRAAYVVLGVTAEGYKEILSIAVGANETSKFWLGMLNDLHNRGVKDVLFFCVDGLPGFKEAIQAVFPKAEIQRCVIHMLRNSFKYVSYKDLKKFASDFKAVYNAPNEAAALSELENIKEAWGRKYPYAISNWENNWEDVSPFFQFPDDIRRIMYTTNIIEGLNRQYRKVTKTKSVFPSDTSLEKMLYLASQNVTKKWTQRYRNWDQVLNQLIVLYGERLTEYL